MLDTSDYEMPRRRNITVTWTSAHERAWQQITASRKTLLARHESVTKIMAVLWIAFVILVGTALWRWYQNYLSTNALLLLLVVYHFFERYDAKRMIRAWETLSRTKDIHTVLRVRRWLTHDAKESLTNTERAGPSQGDQWEPFPSLFVEPDDELNDSGLLGFEVQTPGRAL